MVSVAGSDVTMGLVERGSGVGSAAFTQYAPLSTLAEFRACPRGVRAPLPRFARQS